MTEPITLEPDYKGMAIELQERGEALESLADDRQQQIFELEDEVTKLKGVIEYLEKKLGLDNSI